MSLLCNDVSHRLGAYLDWSLCIADIVAHWTHFCNDHRLIYNSDNDCRLIDNNDIYDFPQDSTIPSDVFAMEIPKSCSKPSILCVIIQNYTSDHDTDGSVKDCGNSSVSAMELQQCCNSIADTGVTAGCNSLHQGIDILCDNLVLM